jgi:hypothetical protein
MHVLHLHLNRRFLLDATRPRPGRYKPSTRTDAGSFGNRYVTY